MDKWNNTEPSSDNGAGLIHDSTFVIEAIGSTENFRGYPDQILSEGKPGQIRHTDADGKVTWMDTHTHAAEKKPWILERAKNWVSGLRNADKVGINPKDQLGTAKVPMHLVPPSSTILQALCMDDGNIKYGPYNVRMEPIQAIGYISAAKRHLDAYLDGQDCDSITGKPHLGYALATIGLVIDAWLNGTLIDNRPVPGIGGYLLDALAMKPGEEPRGPDEYKRIFDAVEAYGKAQTEARLHPTDTLSKGSQANTQ